MKADQLALTLVITGIASGFLAVLNEERLKTTSPEDASVKRCMIEGSQFLSRCGAAPAEDDVVASDGQGGQDTSGPAPSTGGETPMARLPIYG